MVVDGAMTFNLFQEVFTVGFLLYAVRDLVFSPAAVGAVLVAGGLGSFAGAWFGSRLSARWGYGWVLVGALALGNTAPLASARVAPGTPGAVGLLIAVFLVMGIGIGASNAHAVTIRQVATPTALLGRANAAYRLITWARCPSARPAWRPRRCGSSARRSALSAPLPRQLRAAEDRRTQMLCGSREIHCASADSISAGESSGKKWEPLTVTST
ncbi:hypothetical protein GCM10009741_23140 [Kribbella lupini]|uniref:MFS transporter n=1 Tax=Kribbella lupini TaxID=291602 RepID=A0ABP4LDA0_9ACTN